MSKFCVSDVETQPCNKGGRGCLKKYKIIVFILMEICSLIQKI